MTSSERRPLFSSLQLLQFPPLGPSQRVGGAQSPRFVDAAHVSVSLADEEVRAPGWKRRQAAGSLAPALAEAVHEYARVMGRLLPPTP